MRFSSRFFLYGPFALFVALAASVMTYWWFAAAALSQRLDALEDREIAPGVHLHFGSKRIAGFPFRLDAVFTDFTVRIAGARGPIAWHAERLAAHTLTYARDVIVFEAAGKQNLSWVGLNGARHEFDYTPGALRASAIVDGSKLVRFDLDAISLYSPKFAAGRAQFHMRRDPSFDALDLVLDLQSVRFAGDAGAGFADGLMRVRIEGRLSPAAPYAPTLSGQADWRQALESWRVAPGVFKVDEAAILWAKCQATSSGNITLDDGHRPSGSLAFSLADCDALAKEAEGVNQASRAHRPIIAVLADLAAHEPADRNDAFPATVVFKDGLIYIGPGRPLASGSYFEPVGFLHALY